MRKIESEYEIDKQKRKQRLVRNEFLYNGESVGAYDMPLIRKQEIDVEKIQLLCYADARNGDEKTRIRPFIFSRTIGNSERFMTIPTKNLKNSGNTMPYSARISAFLRICRLRFKSKAYSKIAGAGRSGKAGGSG